MKYLVAPALILLLTIPCSAQDAPSSGTPLTKARAKSFVACLADMVQIGKKYEDLEGSAGLFGYEGSDVEGAMTDMAAHPAYNEVMSTLKTHGFEGGEDWAQTSQRFVSAYSSLKMEEDGTDMDTEVKNAIDQVNANTMLTDEQKKQMIDMIKAQQQALDEMQDGTTEADRDAVRSVMEEFEKLTEVE